MANDTKAVFISYRRDESAGYAGRIADSFVEHFGEDKVFRDLDSLEPGLDFAEAIERAIESSEVLLAVIGKNWLTATDTAGRKRLENPDDYVRTEISTALKRNIRVIPLLVQDADMPSASELPDDLAPLSRRNAFEIHDSSWRDDIRRLVTALEGAIKGDRPATPAEPGAVKQPEAQPEAQPEEDRPPVAPAEPEENQPIMQQVWGFLEGRPQPEQPEEDRSTVAPAEPEENQPIMGRGIRIALWVCSIIVILLLLLLLLSRLL